MYYVCNVLRPCIGYTKFAGKCVHVSKHPFNDYNAASIYLNYRPCYYFFIDPASTCLISIANQGAHVLYVSWLSIAFNSEIGPTALVYKHLFRHI